MQFFHNETPPHTNGIYYIGFLQTDKKYVGSASSYKSKYTCRKGFRARWQVHLQRLKKGDHHSKRLQNAYNKYGLENIYICILEECEPKNCVNREQYWIDHYDSYKNGYNCAPIANSMLGFNHTEKTKTKMSETKRKIKEKKLNKNSNKIIELYKKNLTIKEVSKEVGICHELIAKHLKDKKIKIKTKGDYKKQGVYVFNIETEDILFFDSVSLCSRTLEIDDRKIWRVVKQYKHPQIKDKLFSFEKNSVAEFKEKIRPIKNSSKRKGKKVWVNIKQINKNGDVVKIWKNSKEVIEYYNLKNLTSILRCMTGKRKTFKGFSWVGELKRFKRYKNETFM